MKYNFLIMIFGIYVHEHVVLDFTMCALKACRGGRCDLMRWRDRGSYTGRESEGVFDKDTLTGQRQTDRRTDGRTDGHAVEEDK